MKRIIVTEGEYDKLLIAKVLRTIRGVPSFETDSGGGRSSAISMAQSYLAVTEARVALVVDANTTFEEEVKEKEAFLRGLLSYVSAPERFGVFQAVPSVEVCLFQIPKSKTERLVGRKISEEQWIRGRFEPKKVLLELLGGGAERTSHLRILLRRALPPELTETPLVAELASFLRQPAQQDAGRASSVR
jgi:hypothetical protein